MCIIRIKLGLSPKVYLIEVIEARGLNLECSNCNIVPARAQWYEDVG